ncbi:helix-turn-helix domain-containing protein [Spirosoma pollinicola]|uniref:AraC family transcriptional regulator n=1 Tax=Spirosoma pollinicola TaxID=2057025 RepID=A0A2K8Z9R9_9BACT|nr:helix-turn-helix transcriptional regulator [Spirosoma pollinicola]AUD06604.1 AraC family transcriptional regulator [Spirosoma pollinicola]
MNKVANNPHKIDSITDAHRECGLPTPRHPLVSLINGFTTPVDGDRLPQNHVLGFYKVSYKPKLGGRLKYGQRYYDFDEGGLLFASPGQLIGSQDNDASVCSEYTLLIHPDFFLGYPLAKTIKRYGFFSYATNETLHLSDDEKGTILAIFKLIETELNSRIDDFSQDVIVAQSELLLSYANRFYKRQFLTRKAVNHDLLQQLEEVLDRYFTDQTSVSQGLPTVGYLAQQVHLSPSYLSDMLRALVGQNAQQYIHDKLITIAKEQLSTTGLSVGEVAYALGFEHSQSFSKLFKSKTNQSPVAFRQSFN